ncbi:MAG: hypothetical protein QNK03_03055 [Myxococcota bacterium]|nr:hypothetical protein [Myxococcota bacterium]
MKTRIARRFLTALLLLALVPAVAPAQEETDQLYLVAFEAPLGSISSAGQGETAVYVRFDTVEGGLPADLVELELLRDGAPLGTFPATGSMNDAEIIGLYANAANQRRLLELVRWFGDEDPEAPVSPANFLEVLRERVLEVPPRAALAARVDFNVARALYRGHLDTGLVPGSYEYELRGRFTGGQDVRLGLVTALVDGAPDVAPEAANFAQVSLRRCDAPERGKDHHTVALDWDHPGASAADRYAHSLVIAGYDLYRTLESVDDVPLRDLRSEAAATAHDEHGRVALDGLEKVNDQPISVGGSGDTLELYEGFNPAFAQFFETGEDLRAAGVEPGESRAYYLVARTQSGNYGATTGLLVRVPDLDPPVAPWQVRGDPRYVDEKFTLTWPHVHVRSYHEQHQVGRRYCNLDSARIDGFLDYVPQESRCEERLPLRADLQVADYLVYRFRDSGRAARFLDADGDGYHDADERTDITDPGTACDPALPGEGAPIENNLVAVVPAAQAAPSPSGRLMMRYVDSEPGQNPGDQFWYRVASRDEEGNVSPASHPVPGLVSVTTIPQRDETLGGLVFGRRVCEHTITPVQTRELFTAYDTTEYGSAHTLRISCEPNANEATPVVELPFEDFPDGSRRAVLPAEQCARLSDPVAGCLTKPTLVEHLDRRGRPLSGGTLAGPYGLQCPGLATELIEICHGSVVVIDEGEVVPPEEGPLLDPGPGPNCTKVYRHVDGRRTQLETLCPGDDPLVLADLPDLGSDPICLSVASYDENAQGSLQLRLPCFRRPGKPSPPTPVALGFTPGSAEGTASFLHAELPAEGAVIEWQRLGHPETRQTRFVTRPEGPDLGMPAQLALELTPEPAGEDWREEWCFRGLSLGGALLGDPETGVSDWSPKVCSVRQPVAAAAVESLGWPQIASPPEGPPIQARFLDGDELPVLLLSEPIPFNTCPLFLPACEPEFNPETPCVGEPGNPPAPIQSTNCDVCSVIDYSFSAPPPFVVYRQSRRGLIAPPTDFAQVSPLVEPYCESSSQLSVLDDPFVSLVNFGSGDETPGLRLVFVDRTGYREDLQYRYQVVFFTGSGEPYESRTSAWVQL